MNIPINRMAGRSNTGFFVKYAAVGQTSRPMDFPHRDDYYMFVVLLKGDATAAVDFRNMSLAEREGLILAPGQVHHIPHIRENVPTAWCLFVSSDYISATDQDRIERYSFATSPFRFSRENIEIVAQLFDILNRNQEEIEFARAMVTAIINRFCVSLPESDARLEDRYVKITIRFKHLLRELYAKEKHPAEYASCLHVSRVYLNEAVKAVTGMSVGAFIRNHVILNAKRMLVYTDLDVNEIAENLGYEDYSYFSRLFRKETGMTPSEFRKNLV